VALGQWLRERCRPGGVLELAILGFALSGVLALVRSDGVVARAPELLAHAVLLGAVPLARARAVKSVPASRVLVTGLVSLVALVALAGVTGHLRGLERTEGFYGGYFTLAATLVCALPLAAGLLLTAAPRAVPVWGGVMAIALAALWWTYTRSAFLALAVAMSTWAAWACASWWRRGVSLPASRAWVLVAVPLLLVILVLTARDSRINPITNEVRASDLTLDLSSGRRGIFADACQWTARAVRERRFVALAFGHGLASRQRLVGGPFTSWESDYVQAFMNQGIFGLGCVVLIAGCLLVRARHGFASGDPVAAGLAAAAVAQVVLSLLTLQLTSFGGAGWCVLLATYLGRGRPSRRAVEDPG
jgi:hypothetical protein